MNQVKITMSIEQFDKIMVALKAGQLYCSDQKATLIANELDNAYHAMDMLHKRPKGKKVDTMFESLAML